MKNRDFKRLGDDTKKIEKNAKLYHIGLIVNMSLLLIIIIFIVIVFVFKLDFFHKGKNKISAENNVSSNISINQGAIPFSDFEIKIEGSKYFITGKSSGNAQKIVEANPDTVLLGTYGNRLYFYDNIAISFVSFENNDYKREEWLRFRQYKSANTSETGILNLDKAYLKDDRIYFKYTANIKNSSSTSGILSLGLNDDSFEKSKQLIPTVSGNNWTMIKDKACIYYVTDGKILNRYNIDQQKSDVVMSDATSVSLCDDKALYLKLSSSYKESDNAMVHAATYHLYRYDLNTQESTLIFESSVANIKNSSLDGFAQLYKGDVYYKDNNSIVKYNNGENQVVYSDESSNNYLDGFNIINDSTIQLNMQGGVKKYLVNGSVVDNI